MKNESTEENISLINTELLKEIEKMAISKEEKDSFEKLIFEEEENISDETKKLLQEIEKETSVINLPEFLDQETKVEDKTIINKDVVINNKLGTIGATLSLFWSFILIIILTILTIEFSLYFLILFLFPILSIGTNILFLKGKNNKISASILSFTTLGVGIIAGIMILLSKKEQSK